MCGDLAWTQAAIVASFAVVTAAALGMAVLCRNWPFYLLLQVGTLFAFSTCSLGLRAIEHVFDGGTVRKHAS